ncbi:MAG: formate dehydrogenase accessory sulfurtransferase FdhD [Spongiibacteraceae bacterium]
MAVTMKAGSIYATNVNTLNDLRKSHLQEVMVSICIDGISYAVMLASPYELEDFARGFAIGESLIQHDAELRDIHIQEHADGITLDLHLSARASNTAKQRRRALLGTSGCGLCGADAIAQAHTQRPPRLPATRIPRIEQIMQARERLAPLQVRNREAGGGMHAAALFTIGNATNTTNTTAQIVREDIGRHNALDKLIGAMARSPSNSIANADGDSRTLSRQDSFVMLTSRCSYELVVKCARANIGCLITFAMPTNLAIECARECNVTLACFQGPQLFFYHKAMDDTSA